MGTVDVILTIATVTVTAYLAAYRPLRGFQPVKGDPIPYLVAWGLRLAAFGAALFLFWDANETRLGPIIEANEERLTELAGEVASVVEEVL